MGIILIVIIVVLIALILHRQNKEAAAKRNKVITGTHIPANNPTDTTHPNSGTGRRGRTYNNDKDS